MAQFPHCDELVLHAPTKCFCCDKFPEKQQERIKNNINFTGETILTKKPCPSILRRPLNIINKWPGNIAITKEMQEKREKELKKEIEEIERLFFKKLRIKIKI